MKNVTSSSGKVLFIVLIVLVIIIGFSVGAGVYFKKIAHSSKPASQPVTIRHKIPSSPIPPENGMFGDKAKTSNPATQAAPPVASQVLEEAGSATGVADVASAPESDVVVEAEPLDEKFAMVSTAVESENPKPPSGDASAAAESGNPAIPAGDAPIPLSADEKPSPQVGNPEPSSEAEDEIATSAVVDSGTMEETDFFAIQVGAYRLKDNASKKVAELHEKGYDAFIIETGETNSPWYMVRFGRYTNKVQAQVSLAEYKQKEKAPAIIMRSVRN